MKPRAGFASERGAQCEAFQFGKVLFQQRRPVYVEIGGDAEMAIPDRLEGVLVIFPDRILQQAFEQVGNLAQGGADHDRNETVVDACPDDALNDIPAGTTRNARAAEFENDPAGHGMGLQD